MADKDEDAHINQLTDIARQHFGGKLGAIAVLEDFIADTKDCRLLSYKVDNPTAAMLFILNRYKHAMKATHQAVPKCMEQLFSWMDGIVQSEGTTPEPSKVPAPSVESHAAAAIAEQKRAEVAAAVQPGPAPPGHALPPSALPPIPESQEVERRPGLTLEQLHLQVQELRLANRLRGFETGDSATTAGRSILARAARARLVEILPAARDAAAQWLSRAAQGLQRRFQAATQPDSKLPEAAKQGDSVQGVFSDILKYFKAPFGSCVQFHDVHDKKSVCSNWRPDVVMTSGAYLIPSNTKLVLDLKRQDKQYNSPAHMHQIATYGAAVLEQVPDTLRAKVLVGVTDLQHIQFLLITRTACGALEYAISEEMGNVLPALCAVMLEASNNYGEVEPPALMLHGAALQLEAILGAGATSVVYQVGLPVGDGHQLQPAAAKVFHATYNTTCDHELRVLKALQAGGCSNVPRVAGQLDGGAGLLLQPVGTPLGTYGAVSHPQLFTAITPLVASLHRVHELGWVHCDVRPDNLLLVTTDAHSNPQLLLVDWGFAKQVPMDETQKGALHLFSGTTRFASDSVLRQLAPTTEEEVARCIWVRPADDLESLVKVLFALSHREEVQKLLQLGTHQFQAIQQCWTELLQLHPWWQGMLAAARNGLYDDVAAGLTNRFD